jgi:hypothetical protein
MGTRSGRLERAMDWTLHHADHIWIGVLSVFILLALALGCNSLKRLSMVGGGAAGGAAAGTLVGGPPGAIAGAAIGGAGASAFVESDIAEERAERLEDHLAYRGPSDGFRPPPEPPLWECVPVWGWLAGLWAWLRRAHLADALTGKEPRMDAILRALGWRTHKTTIPKKGGAA